jgi:hypothetical membrane protein
MHELSDMGIGNSALAYNLGLIMADLFATLFAFGLKKGLKLTGTLGTIGVAVFIIGSISLLLTGIFNTGYAEIHEIVSSGYFVFSPLAVIIIGIAKKNVLWKLCIPSVILGVASLFTITLLPRASHAIPEIIEAILLSIWLCYTGLWLLRNHRIK